MKRVNKPKCSDDCLKQKALQNRKTVKNRGKNIREEFLADKMRVPEDVSLGTMRITLTGNHKVWVENFKKIVEYTDTSVILQGKTQTVCVEGNRLCIEYYTGDDMMIKGSITCVCYHK